MDLDGYKECLEFEARLLEAKQWKTRSFVARLRNDGSGIPQLNVYKKGKLKKTINFYDYYGMESGTLIDGEVLTLSVICLSDTSVIAFSDESNLLGFENWLRSYLGYGCSFHCYVLFAPSRSGLQAEQYVRLHLQDNRFCLVAGIPGSLVLKFFTSDVQCYGAVRNKFCFQVKSTCTSAPYGTYVLRSSHCGKMDAYFCLASRMQLNYFLLQRAMNCSYGKENTSEPEPPLLSDDRQSEDCLNELLSPYGSPMAARNGSFSYRLLEQELPFDHQKLRVKSSSSLNNETNDMTCERSCSLIRMYSDSQLGSPPLKMCHRCFQHKYINQSFVDSLEFYDNCKFARSDRVMLWKLGEIVSVDAQVGHDGLCHDKIHHSSGIRSATRKFMPHRFLPRRLKRTLGNGKHFGQKRVNEVDDMLNNWALRCSDSKSYSPSSSYVVAKEQKFEAEESRDACKKRLFGKLNMPPLKERTGQSSTTSLSAVEFSQAISRHPSSPCKGFPASQSSALPLACTDIASAVSSASQSTCAKLWETKLNCSGTRHRLRATLSSYIRGSFSCYDGDCPDEVPMVSSAIVPQEPASASSKPDRLLKAPLSAPCLPPHATVFDFPSTTAADYREIVLNGRNVAKSKSSSLPCHGSRQRRMSNYVHIDMAATQAARKIASQRAEEFIGQSLPVRILSGSEGALSRKKSNAGSSLAIADFVN